MQLQDAIRIARQWVSQEGARIRGFLGAYLAGSAAAADPAAPYSPTSDLDIVVVTPFADDLPKPGKFRFQNVLLEVSLLADALFRSEEALLTTHYLCYALDKNVVFSDPTGLLTGAVAAVQRSWARPEWIRRRCEVMEERVRRSVAGFDPTAPYQQCAMSYLFIHGLSIYPILLADLENCTVRKRYTAVRRALERRGAPERYAPILRRLDPNALSAERLLFHLRNLEIAFDAACASHGPSASLPYRSDISAQARSVAIDGSREILLSPWPGEAIFWIGVTFARCHTILCADGSPDHPRLLPDLQSFMADLGVPTPSAMADRIHLLF